MDNPLASDLNKDILKLELKGVLFPGEKVVSGYRLIKDLVVFTDYRLLIIDSQGMRGRKVYYKIIPYKSISRFTMETSNASDLDSELKVYIGSSENPTEVLKIETTIDVNKMQQLLSQAVLDGNLKDMIM